MYTILFIETFLYVCGNSAILLNNIHSIYGKSTFLHFSEGLVHIVYICAVVSGKFELLEHEAAKWLDKDSLDSVAWLPADLGLVDKLKDYLSKNRS